MKMKLCMMGAVARIQQLQRSVIVYKKLEDESRLVTSSYAFAEFCQLVDLP